MQPYHCANGLAKRILSETCRLRRRSGAFPALWHAVRPSKIPSGVDWQSETLRTMNDHLNVTALQLRAMLSPLFDAPHRLVRVALDRTRVER